MNLGKQGLRLSAWVTLTVLPSFTGCWRRTRKPREPWRWKHSAKNTGRRCRPWWQISVVLRPGSRPGWRLWKPSEQSLGPRWRRSSGLPLGKKPTHPSVPRLSWFQNLDIPWILEALHFQANEDGWPSLILFFSLLLFI